MSKPIWKLVSATMTLALFAALAMPQSGPLGKRHGGGGGGGNSGGGGSSSGGSSGRGSGGGGGSTRNDPPPRRNDGGGSRGGGGGSQDNGGSRGGGGGGSQDDGSSRGNGGGGRIQSGGPPVIISGDDDGRSRPRNGGSRSGRVNYGTNGNEYSRGQIGSVRIERAPVIINNGRLQNRVDRSERNVGLVRNGYRYGYYHYRRDWRDDYFCYPFYSFDPWAYNRCVVSPWYYYVSLPPYLNYSRVTIVNVFPTSNWYGESYRWRPIDRNDRYNRYEDLDYAIEDIVDAFQDSDRRSLDRLVPRGGTVNIYTEGNYSYSLGADDFYDLYRDGIQNAQTIRYEITDVQRDRNGNARVLARHEFNDPWGSRQVVWHTYYLQREGRDYVIREFGTNYYRNGW